jgi:simple sugar transport system ATP-binding protein
VTAPLARLLGITRSFGPTRALRGAELEVGAGEVHGVLGENGAGKSTLLAVLAGLLQPDAGRVEIDGVARTLTSPRDAWAAGIGMVHQHFTLVPALTVLENLALGRRSARGGFALPHEELRSRIQALSERTGLSVPLEARVEELGVGDRQRTEILKALLREPRLLVLDEPTAVLAPPEVASLFRLLRALVAEGRGVVLVAHKLDEIMDVADRVTVLRRGRTVLKAPVSDVDTATLVEAMVGGGESDAAALGAGAGRIDGSPVAPAPRGARVVGLEDVRVRGSRGEWAVDGASLDVRRGEIVGVVGVEGNGQRELALVLSGRMAPDAGAAQVPPGVGFISQDRSREGLILDFDLTANVALALARDPAYRNGPLLRWSALARRTREMMARFDVRAASAAALASSLSGGNQQRLVVARELAMASDLLVAENPTRGLDVAASAFVHRALTELAARSDGPGVVLISTDLDEVLAMAHRVLVMTRGRLIEVAPDARSREAVGATMVAGTRAPGAWAPDAPVPGAHA